MTGLSTTNGRLFNEGYLQLSEGQRTAVVVGMADMLEYAAMFIADPHNARFDAVLKVALRAIQAIYDDYSMITSIKIRQRLRC